jgi:hypothetical protein
MMSIWWGFGDIWEIRRCFGMSLGNGIDPGEEIGPEERIDLVEGIGPGGRIDLGEGIGPG